MEENNKPLNELPEEEEEPKKKVNIWATIGWALLGSVIAQIFRYMMK